MRISDARPHPSASLRGQTKPYVKRHNRKIEKIISKQHLTLFVNINIELNVSVGTQQNTTRKTKNTIKDIIEKRNQKPICDEIRYT